jgi:ribosomal RNA-processing protein 9
MTDLLTSGSCDGYVRLWKCNASLKCFIMTNQIPVEGFVVSIHLSSSLMAIGTSKEHRMGRWCSVKGNRNKVVILKFENSLESSLLEECDEMIENDDDNDDDDEEGDDIDDD